MRISPLVPALGLALIAFSAAASWQPLYDAVQTDFKSTYALEDFKRARYGWDREAELDRLRVNLIDRGPQPVISAIRRDFQTFFMRTRDYHTGMYFKGPWALSVLPFGVRTVGGHAYVTYVDRKWAPPTSFPISAGDELVAMNGTPVLDALAKLTRRPEAYRATDLSFADRFLTKRPAYEGFPLPSGTVRLEFRKADGQHVTLAWTWRKVPNSALSSIGDKSTENRAEILEEIPARVDRRSGEEPTVSPTPNFDPVNTIGSRYPFTPAIGKIIWRSAPTSHFFAEIGETGTGRRVGFIRIATYAPEKPVEALREFNSLIARMQAGTDVLVLDQTGNGGGSVLYFYELLSHLIAAPVPATLRFRWSLQPMNEHLGEKWEVLEEKLRDVQTDEDARRVLGDHLHGYPVDLSSARGALLEARTVLADLRAGGDARLSRSIPLLGIDRVEPKGSVYRKPIVLLQNEFSFSAADMAAAMLQDLRRARIFGSRSAGAGSYAVTREAPAPNPFGVWFYRIAMAEVRRGSGVPLENVGVQPDLRYDLRPVDFAESFRGYGEALTRYLDQLPLEVEFK